MRSEWWRTAVVYQIHLRSFADAEGLEGAIGDGMGDLEGVTRHLDDLCELGVDAVWLSPFMPSPQRDAGYDISDYRGVDPAFGTLRTFDRLLEAAHARGVRVLIDIVPNHSSFEHVWFQAALAAGPGTRERDRYVFREGAGPRGEEPPTDWPSAFGGSAWTRVIDPDGQPGHWYLHLFDETQPDFNWDNEDVRAEFEDILRFWLDRGVDGFRVNAAHGLVKDPGFPDVGLPSAMPPAGEGDRPSPYWAQDGVHEIWREWRRIVDAYDGDRVLCAEAWMSTADEIAPWAAPGEMHQALGVPCLLQAWRIEDMRRVIDDGLRAHGSVGAPATWVLSSHDVVRHATRFGIDRPLPRGAGLGPRSPEVVDAALGARRARAATALVLALPGSAYLYQGEELGLPEVIDLPDEARRDPTFFRTGGAAYGRDGCRVPLPWSSDAPAYGFSASGSSWLPQPAEWAGLARDVQRGDPDSTLNLYRELLRIRRERNLGGGSLEWVDAPAESVLAFRSADTLVVVNFGEAPLPLPETPLVTTSPLRDGALPPDATAWIAQDAQRPGW
ncbi:MAG: glycoside hydrolase family 13 protein [Microbacterium sp.]